MKVKDKISKKKEAIDGELRRILSREDSLLFQAMRYAVFSGGKRFRPLLALSSGECFGVSQDVVLPFACALELIHNYSLIHDDLPSMDNDDFRRGKPSCHKVYGEDIALLAGDCLLTLAFDVLAQAPLEEKLLPKRVQIIRDISRLTGIGGMIEGQFMDVTLSPENISEEDFYELVLKKSGSLIIASVKTGANLGEALSSQIEAMVEYGRNVGFAFQIRDDILDSVKETEKGLHRRPNSVELFGPGGARQRLRSFIDQAQCALDTASLESEELRYLALRLLELKSGNEDE